VLSMNGITMINVGDKFVKAVPVGQAPTEGAKPTAADKDQLPEAGQYVTITKQIKYAKPSELVPILQGFSKIPNSLMPIDSSGILIIRDYAENAKRILELIEQIDVTTPLDYETRVIPIKYALASEIATALGSLGGGTGTSIGHSSASSGSPAGIGGGFGGAGGGGINGGGIGGSRFGTSGGLGTPGSTGYSPGGATTGARGTSFQDRLQRLVTKASSTGDFQVLGQTKIIADERTNSLLVFAGKQDMDMITNIIDKLDVVLAQVLIEAIIMEVTLSDSQTLGVSYLQKSASSPGNYFSGIGAVKNGGFLSANNFSSVATNAAGALPSGFSYFASFGNDFEATLTAIADDHKVNVLSRPRIQTSHAVPASLQIGDTVPYVTGTSFNGYNGSPSSQYQQTFVGINLQVTPLINPDGLVVMDITQDIQQLGPSTTIDGNQVPTTTKRTAQAKVSVRDRDTIILGGFISTTKTKDKSGVPILKDIPGLGYLFRSTADSNKRVELIVMIRPTVLPNPGDAALVATQERNHMPGVRAFEAEYQADEAKRVKAGDRLQAERDAADAKKRR
ncbi:MAG: Type and secretion system protein, partial [Pedosphaera sp.]|nr:Type and secretion system protein [Pedosphaera sp.]